MFNEILTGQASLEQKAVVADPYRQESIPQITLTCVDCAKTYPANIGTPPGRCGACHVRFAEANAAASARAYAGVQDGIERRKRNAWLLRTAALTVCGIALALFKLGMRHQMAEDARQAAGVSGHESTASFDPYAMQADDFARTMCACHDASCAQDTLVQFERWTRATPSPTDSDALDAASAATAKLGDCYAKLRP